MALYCLAGETIRVKAKDLTHASDGSVTSGVTGTIGIYTTAGATETEDTSPSNSGDDWYADLTAPSTAGEYVIKISLTYSGAVWRARDPLIVRAF